METVLLHKSAFLYVTSIFRLSSFVFANALLTGITKTFVPFYSSFPEILCMFVFYKHDKSSIYEENAIHYPLMGGLCTTVSVAKAQERLPEYLQAEKYTQEKLNTMLFSTVVDPHWFQKGNNFWFEYKTSEGTFWYVVDPAARTKKLLFDRDELASQLTEIVKDPFEARHLPITNLKAEEDGRTFTFEVKSTKDATPKKDGKDKKDKKNEKEIFYFSYDYPTRKLTHLKDKEDDLKKIYWGSVSPDGKTVIYAKDLNLYRMSREDYEKAKKMKRIVRSWKSSLLQMA